MNVIFSDYRYGVPFKTVADESKSITEEVNEPWKETTLLTILSRYTLKGTFNADEFGLFYQALPSKTIRFKGQKCSGGKHSKVHLTGLAASNAFVKRHPVFAVGKAENPRCFKGVKQLPLSI